MCMLTESGVCRGAIGLLQGAGWAFLGQLRSRLSAVSKIGAKCLRMLLS